MSPCCSRESTWPPAGKPPTWAVGEPAVTTSVTWTVLVAGQDRRRLHAALGVADDRDRLARPHAGVVQGLEDALLVGVVLPAISVRLVSMSRTSPSWLQGGVSRSSVPGR